MALEKCKCGAEFFQYTTLQNKCVPCLIKDGKKIIKKELMREKKDLKARKEAVKTNAQWADEAQEIFNKMRRLEELLWFKERGIEPYCISCQKPLGNDQWCCGHFKTRGARPDLAFDQRNAYLQHNVRCNKNLSGDTVNYKIGLLYRFGQREGQAIIDYCEVHQKTPKRTTDDWKAMKKEYRARIRELEKTLQEFN